MPTNAQNIDPKPKCLSQAKPKWQQIFVSASLLSWLVAKLSKVKHNGDEHYAPGSWGNTQLDKRLGTLPFGMVID